MVTFVQAMSALLNAIPPAVGLPFSLLNARHSDATGERIYHAIAGEIIVTVGFILSSLLLRARASPSTALELASLSTVIVGDGIFIVPFLAYSADILPSSSAAAGIAVVTIGGSVGNVFGPTIVGTLLHSSGGFAVPLLALLGLVVLSLVLLFSLLCVVRRRRLRRRRLLLDADAVNAFADDRALELSAHEPAGAAVPVDL